MNILVMYNYRPGAGHLERLKRIAGMPVIAPRDEEEARRHSAGSVAFLGHRYLRQCLAAGPAKLRWVQLLGGGIDHLGIDFRGAPYTLTRTTFASEPIAWHAFTLMLALVRGLHCNGRRLLPMPKKALILGFGEIGRHLGRRLQDNGIEVHGVRRTPGPAPECDFLHHDHWEGLLPEMDACFLALPLSASTEGIFSASCFARLKETAVVVVIGRARTVQLDGLEERLPKIGGIAFDCPDTPPLTDERTLVTPWVAARYPERPRDNEDYMEAQLERFIRGAPLQNVVRVSGSQTCPKPDSSITPTPP